VRVYYVITAIIYLGSLMTSFIYVYKNINCNYNTKYLFIKLDTIRIFLRNSAISLLLILGFISFGVMTLIILCINGVITGSMLALASKKIGLVNALLLILPHGIIEIPVMLVFSVWGLMLGVKLYKRENIWEIITSKKFIAKTLLLFLLLAIAALIEVNVTGVIYWRLIEK